MEEIPLSSIVKHPLPSPDFNDVRTIFAALNLSSKELCKLERQFRGPCSLDPLPSPKAVNSSPYSMYYFAFYMRPSDIRDLAVEYDEDRMPFPDMSLDDIHFAVQSLSLIMAGDHVVRLEKVLVTEDHIQALPEIAERAGESALAIVVLSTSDYSQGYHPSYREVQELTDLLGRKPCWWEARPI